MDKIQRYKQILNNESVSHDNQKLASQLLELINYYESKNDQPALKTLIFIMDTGIKIKDNIIILNFSKDIQEKINVLYNKKFKTFKFGSKSIEDILDDLINEA